MAELHCKTAINSDKATLAQVKQQHVSYVDHRRYLDLFSVKLMTDDRFYRTTFLVNMADAFRYIQA